MKTTAKKFKTAQGFLESRYNAEFGYVPGLEGETTEAKIQRSDQATRNAVRSLLSAMGFFNVKISDDENLKQAVERIQKMPEAQNDQHQHYLTGARAWLKRGRFIAISSTLISVTDSSDAA